MADADVFFIIFEDKGNSDRSAFREVDEPSDVGSGGTADAGPKDCIQGGRVRVGVGPVVSIREVIGEVGGGHGG